MTRILSMSLRVKIFLLLALSAGVPPVTAWLLGAPDMALPLGLAMIPFSGWLLMWLLRPLESLVGGLERQTSRDLISLGKGRETRIIARAINGARSEAAALRSRNRRYRELQNALLDNLPLGVAFVDAKGRLTRCNRNFLQLTGHEERTVLGRSWNSLIAEEDRDAVKSLWDDWVQAEEGNGHGVRVKHKAGGTRWVELRVRPTVDPEAKGAETMLILRDITMRKHCLDLLHMERRKTMAVLDSISESVILASEDDHVQYVNPAAQKLLAMSCEDLVGQPLFSRIPLYPRQRGGALLEPGRSWAGCDSIHRCVLRDPHGASRDVDLLMTSVQDNESRISSRIYVFRTKGVARDGLSRDQWEATHDALTGLANRELFEANLDAALDKTRKTRTPAALALVDLDHFRQLNEGKGREAGDEVLKQVARILLRNVRQGDLVARLGGDQFGLILGGCDSNRALLITESIRADVEHLQHRVGEDGPTVTASIGVTEMAATDPDGQSILQRADEGCCRAKAQGRNLVNLVRVAAWSQVP